MPVFYVARDIERALGKNPGADYRIITNRGAYSEEIRKQYPEHVFLLDRSADIAGSAADEPLDTFELIAHPGTEKIINAEEISTQKSPASPVSILVFKNTSRIEDFCKEKKWPLLNPPAVLAEQIENKISQIAWLGDAATYLPAHEIVKMSDIGHVKIPRPFMIQWAHGHTGDGTVFIPAGESGDKILANLRGKFPDREARVTEYIAGPMFTVNMSVAENILMGNVSYQITGMLPFTDNPFATVGNDWSLPHTILSEEKISDMRDIARAVGKKMLESGWSGLFGIDCIFDEGRGGMHLIEINARQPASAAYESRLQDAFRAKTATGSGLSGMTVFEAHIAALGGLSDTEKTKKKSSASSVEMVEINDGAQIIQRILASGKKNGGMKKESGAPGGHSAALLLRQKKYAVIEYENTKPGADLLRIQSERGIMETHNKFNARGKEILETVTGTATDSATGML